ncbi:MAG: MMPL family transporter [Deltaproteobacteria bacterium]|nr:MMPL family transporter [Deltaproteobacteria bacterium]
MSSSRETTSSSSSSPSDDSPRHGKQHTRESLRWKAANYIAAVLLRRPLFAFVIGAALTAAGAFVAKDLTFDTRFSALLDQKDPVLDEILHARERIGGTAELIIAIGGKQERRLPFARGLVAELRRQPWVRRADVEFPVRFFLDRRLQLMPITALKELTERAEREVRKAKAKRTMAFVDLEDDEPLPSLTGDSRSLGEKAGLLRSTATSPDGRFLFLRLLPTGSTSDMDAGRQLLERVDAIVKARHPEAEGVNVRYAGGVPLNQEQHRQMTTDLRKAALIALVMILVLLTGWLRRIEAPILLTIPLLGGLAITFGFADLRFAQLNLVSGFLTTALIGLGVDFGIHLYHRYLELLPQHLLRRKEAMQQAIADTLPASATAAATTAAAFLSMQAASFRGFAEYGAIAGFGVIATLVMTYLLLPPLALALTHRPGFGGHRHQAEPRRLRRRLAWPMIIAGVALAVYSATLLHNVRYHNDFNRLRGQSALVQFSDDVDKAFGGSLAPAAILVEGDDGPRRVGAVLDRWVEQRKGSGIARWLSLANMVPERSGERASSIKRLGAAIDQLLQFNLPAKDKENLLQAKQLVSVTPWTTADVPPAYRQLFSTIDNKGSVVLVWPKSRMFADDEVIAWGEELTALQGSLRASGLQATVLDENRISARVLRSMRTDGPRVLLYAGAAVLLLLILDFRRFDSVLMVAGSLAMAMLWVAGFSYLFSIEINVFNQAVIPSLIGLGIDNAVHIQHRYDLEQRRSVSFIVATTGAASLLASATTAIGFGTVVVAQHYGLQTFGWLAVTGFCCTFVATTVFFPALLRLRERPDVEERTTHSTVDHKQIA